MKLEQQAIAFGRAEALAEIRAGVEGLAVHSILGYEWECTNCQYRDGPGGWDTYDPNGNVCGHDELLDRAAVLALLDPK